MGGTAGRPRAGLRPVGFRVHSAPFGRGFLPGCCQRRTHAEAAESCGTPPQPFPTVPPVPCSISAANGLADDCVKHFVTEAKHGGESREVRQQDDQVPL